MKRTLYSMFKDHSPMLLSVLLFVLCSVFWGCATANRQNDDQLEQMQKQLDELKTKVDAIYHRVSVIQFMADSHDRSIKDLEKSRANTPPLSFRKTQKFNADNSEHVGAFSDRSPASHQSVDQPAGKTIKALDQRPVAASVEQRPAKELYQQALATYNQNDFYKAEKLFRMILKQYPQDDLSDNSLYWAGECLYAEKRYSDAIQTFKQVVDEFPEGGKVPDALLKTGYSYISIGDKDNARHFLKEVIKNYPFSKAGAKAENMLKRIQ